MTPEDRETIAQRAGRRLNLPVIRMRLTKDDRARELEVFCKALKGLLPGLSVSKEDHNDPLPSLRLSDNLIYRAIPSAMELPPFLDLLEGASDPAALDGLPGDEILSQLKVPAEVLVFVSPHCPFCPRVVTALLALARKRPNIMVTVVDGTLFSDLATAANVRAAPTVIVDGKYRWTGRVDVRELVNVLISRNPAHMSAASMQRMIEAGDAGALAAMMASAGRVFPGFFDILTHDKWPVRLGAMACFEFLEDARPDMAENVLDALWDRFEPSDAAVKGDILYLMGASKKSKTRGRLSAVVNGDYPEAVREAAVEAMDMADGADGMGEVDADADAD